MCSSFLMSFYYSVVYTLTLLILSSDLTSPTEASWSFHTEFCGNIWKLTNSIWESYPRDLTGLVGWNLWLIRFQHKSPLRYMLIGLCTIHLPKKIFSTTIIFHLHSKKTSGVPSLLDIKLFPTLPEADPMMKLLSLHNKHCILYN